MNRKIILNSIITSIAIFLLNVFIAERIFSLIISDVLFYFVELLKNSGINTDTAIKVITIFILNIDRYFSSIVSGIIAGYLSIKYAKYFICCVFYSVIYFIFVYLVPTITTYGDDYSLEVYDIVTYLILMSLFWCGGYVTILWRKAREKERAWGRS